VGTLVHEAPTLSEKSSETLAENMVVTVEPGVYLPGKFGVRIEDMFVITKSGAIRMSKLPRAVRVIKV
jgi:Xaa-Pro aminopeptidase